MVSVQEERTAKLKTLEGLMKQRAALDVTLQGFAENDPEVIERKGTCDMSVRVRVSVCEPDGRV